MKHIKTTKTAQLYFIFVFLLTSLTLMSCSPKKASYQSVATIRPASHVKDFKDYVVLDAGSSPLSPLSADFNNDGYNDIAVISHGQNHLKIFWGAPNRTFKPGPVYGEEQVGYHPGKITLVDWNNDGFKDILLACEGISQVQLWINNGNGFTKRASVNLNFNPESIQVVDLNDDGKMDIVLGPHQGHEIMILWRKPRFFSFDQEKIKTNPLTENVEVADWNKDARPDIFWIEKKYGSVAVAINRGHRNFKIKYIKKPGIPFGVVKDGPEYVKLADLNEDGCIDAAVPLEVGKACLIYYGNCMGGILKTERIPAPSWGYSGLAVIDKGQNHPPMLALGEELRIFIARKRQGSWKLIEKPAGSLPRDMSFFDIDMDGFIDVLFSNSAGKTIGIVWGPFE